MYLATVRLILATATIAATFAVTSAQGPAPDTQLQLKTGERVQRLLAGCCGCCYRSGLSAGRAEH
jgi:hypothetical protein